MAGDEDPLVLSWKSSILYAHDFEALTPGRWLTDNVVCFWCEVLTHRVFARRADAAGSDAEPDPTVVFMHPAAAFMALFEGARASGVRGISCLLHLTPPPPPPMSRG
jgi:hypothetical protein